MSAQSDIEDALYTAEFTDTFWLAYPRKVGRASALKAYIKARRGDKRNGIASRSQAAIMLGLERYKRETANTKVEFICHAATWLNQRRDADADILSTPKAASVNLHPSWNGSREILERQFRNGEFEAWFAEECFEGGPPPAIICSTLFRAKWIQDHYSSQLRRAFGLSISVRAR